MKIKGSFFDYEVSSVASLKKEIEGLKKDLLTFPIKEDLSIDDLNSLYSKDKVETPQAVSVVAVEPHQVQSAKPTPVLPGDPVVLLKAPGTDEYTIDTPKKIQVKIKAPVGIQLPKEVNGEPGKETLEDSYDMTESLPEMAYEGYSPFVGAVTPYNGEPFEIDGVIQSASDEDLRQIVLDNMITDKVMTAPNKVYSIEDLPLDSIKPGKEKDPYRAMPDAVKKMTESSEILDLEELSMIGLDNPIASKLLK